MSLATFSDLTASIGKWLHRGDLAAIASDFVTLAETRIYQGSNDAQMPTDPLRLVNMEARATGTVSSNTIPIPDGMIEIRRFVVGDGPTAKELTYASRDRLAELQKYPGQPRAYSWDATELTVAPTPDGQYPYTLTYYKRFPALSTNQPTNWLMTNAPNVYLYGALVEAAPYLNNDARMATWYRLFVAALNAVQAMDDRLRVGGGALVMRPR